MRINPTRIDLQNNHNKIKEIPRYYSRMDDNQRKKIFD